MSDHIQNQKLNAQLKTIKMSDGDRKIVEEISIKYSKLLHAVGKL